jgi:hypothetical protein
VGPPVLRGSYVSCREGAAQYFALQANSYCRDKLIRRSTNNVRAPMNEATTLAKFETAAEISANSPIRTVPDAAVLDGETPPLPSV